SVLPLQTSRAFARARTGDAPRKLDFAAVAMGRIGTFIYRRRREVLLLGAILIALAAWGATKMYVNDARILAFKSDHSIVRAADALNERFDGTSHLNIVLTPRRESETGLFLQPDVLRQVEQLEAYTETLDYVGGTHSLAGWVKRAHEKANEGDPDYYAIPNDTEETKFYLDALSSDAPDDRLGMADLLGEIVDPTYTRTNLVVRMKSSQYIHQSPVIESLQAYLDEHFPKNGPLHAQLAGRANLDYHWVRIIRTSHIRSVCLAFVCVLLLTGLMFRSVVAGLLCTMTVGTAVAAIYAMMGFGHIPLGVGTSMFASIAIGAGVNFPIHIIDRLRTRLSDPQVDAEEVFRDTFTFTGRALLFTALVIAGGFLLLCVSEFRTLVRFGLLISAGMVVSFLTSVTLLPALLAVWRPRFLYRARAKRTAGKPDA
ncbi:MAG: MMPL family transporter, partial [Candidatus Nealsonbacteria bacterium]|nr:MMPL family transporter [Candidatus Nealsonbacteria bacterium]